MYKRTTLLHGVGTFIGSVVRIQRKRSCSDAVVSAGCLVPPSLRTRCRAAWDILDVDFEIKLIVGLACKDQAVNVYVDLTKVSPAATPVTTEIVGS